MKYRTNLKVLPRAKVIRILVDEFNVTQGIEYIQNGYYYTALTNREVIISAGVVETPKLMMLSGN